MKIAIEAPISLYTNMVAVFRFFFLESLGIGLSRWEMASSSCSSASDDGDELVFKELLSTFQNAPECPSEHLKLLNFPGGACCQTPHRVRLQGGSHVL